MRRGHSGRIALGAVPLWLFASVPLAFVGLYASPFIPRVLAIYLFFAPQFLFSFSQVVSPAAAGYTPLLPGASAPYVCAALWLAVTLGFSRVARGWPVSRTIWVALVVVVPVTVLVHLGFAALGDSVQLDGP